ncbi:monocarboxylate transporter 10-like [Glandiceps talaboti]
MHESSNARRPEGSFRWVIVFASFWINGTVCSVFNSFGILLVAMLEEPALVESGANASNAAWIGSTTFGLMFLLGAVVGVLNDKFGCRVVSAVGCSIACLASLSSAFVRSLGLLYLTYGVLLGIGLSAPYTTPFVVVNRYFDKRLGLATGLVTAGSGVFTLVFPPILSKLIDVIGLWKSMFAISGFLFLMIFCSLTFRPVQSGDGPTSDRTGESGHQEADSDSVLNEQNNENDGHIANGGGNECQAKGEKKKERERPRRPSFIRRHLNVEIWKNKRYRIYAAAIPLAFLGYFVPFVHLINHVKHVLPDVNGSILLTCLGASSLVSRVLSGLLADKVNSIILHQISILGLGILTMLLPVSTLHFAGVVVAVLLMGIFDGCFVCLISRNATKIVGEKNSSQAIGFVHGFISIPATIGPPIAGFIFDETGSYNLAFIIFGIPFLIAAGLMFFLKDRRTQPAENGNDSNSSTHTVT